MHLTADQPGKLNFDAQFARRDATFSSGKDNRIILRGKLKIDYEAQLVPIAEGGTVESKNGILTVKDADQVTLLINGATSYVNAKDLTANATARCQSPLKAAARKAMPPCEPTISRITKACSIESNWMSAPATRSKARPTSDWQI